MPTERYASRRERELYKRTEQELVKLYEGTADLETQVNADINVFFVGWIGNYAFLDSTMK